jgi:ABC-type transport system involved in multi-copper enzyme maturation permease subunit
MTITFTRFDLHNAFGRGARLLGPLALVLLVSVLTPVPAIGISVAVAVGSLSAAGPFLADERDHLDTLYATLPLTRSAVVVGRYLTAIVVYLVAAAVATIATLSTGAIRGVPLDLAGLAQAQAFGFSVVALVLSVQLPVFFGFGFSRARPMMYAPIAVLAAAAWGAGQLGAIDVVTAGLAAINASVLNVGAVVAGLGLLAASAAIATDIYRRRAL